MKHWAYAIVILALLAFGYWYSERQFNAGKNESALQCSQKENKELLASQKATADEQAKNNKLSGDLATAHQQLAKRESHIRNLEKRYETLAQLGNACNLSIGSILLHNSGLGYEYDPRQLDAEGTAISSITGAAFIQHCNGLAVEFERQRVQLNTLIEAVK